MEGVDSRVSAAMREFKGPAADVIPLMSSHLMRAKQCGWCGKTEGNMLSCSGCKNMTYCSRECQKLGWIRLAWIQGEANSADALTKPLGPKDHEKWGECFHASGWLEEYILSCVRKFLPAKTPRSNERVPVEELLSCGQVEPLGGCWDPLSVPSGERGE